jgi:hypothetical protein
MMSLTVIQTSLDAEQGAARARRRPSIAARIGSMGQNRIGALFLLVATLATIDLSRDLLGSGELARLIRDEHVVGVTTNPTRSKISGSAAHSILWSCFAATHRTQLKATEGSHHAPSCQTDGRLPPGLPAGLR